ncbi:DUF881 domain-containing protein [Eubacterium aggregans]|uniref:Uncharacterized conserved protein YlxW, UPF0749 family n=1 Tax=Eubacterium aggregans TaxID=81409 RepID=A0A1H3XKC0_9FIRM|nr:DUF881 domain-containing protein [Eubacterium aggregans]MDD4690690.1 DUF881 domain-containing protein [Eubacterium aggregans]SDZ99786.1 Uncharacterized conserved protein YlxW, UPF0749 family [Eubacterium aggregans]
MKNTGKLSIAVVSVLVGVLIILSMRAVDQIGGSANTERAAKLASEINALESRNEALEAEKTKLSQKLAQYESSLAEGDDVIKEKLQALEKERIAAGYTDVSGSGIIIAIDVDSTSDYDPSLYASHAELLLTLVNELNAAGAEAVSINGERLVGTTEVRQGGNYVNINKKKFTAPFEVRAIGEPATLAAAVEMRSGIVDVMKSNHLKVGISRQEALEIVAYDGTVDIQYAQPVADDVVQ